MQLEEILTPNRCHCRIKGVSKKRILGTISEIISENIPSLEASLISDALMAREQLGTTALGNGIAIPHCRLTPCKNIIGTLVTLDKGIHFDSLDNKPVDTLFVLLVPEVEHDEHVKTLASLATLFNNESFCHTIRHTYDSEELYNIAVNY